MPLYAEQGAIVARHSANPRPDDALGRPLLAVDRHSRGLALPVQGSLVDDYTVQGPRLMSNTKMKKPAWIWLGVSKHSLFEQSAMDEDKNPCRLVAIPVRAHHLALSSRQ